jgi:hypothetical protein
MSLLYKDKEEQVISLESKTYPDGKVELIFYSDGGKFNTFELLDGYVLSAKELLNILQKHYERF